jgi:hypothetical protein
VRNFDVKVKIQKSELLKGAATQFSDLESHKIRNAN